MSGQRVGYIRVSSLDQVTDRQLEGVAVDRSFTDRASGKDTARPQLAAMLAFVRDGDTVVAHSMDRLARNLDDLRALVRALTAKGVRVEFVKEQLTFTGEDSPMANLLLSVMGAFAEFERALIRERQREGIALAKTRGAYRGRKQSLTPPQAEELRAAVAAGESKAAVARSFGISRQTVYQYLQAVPGPAVGGNVALATVLAALPADMRPMPTVDAYDDLLPSRGAPAADEAPAGHAHEQRATKERPGILGKMDWSAGYAPACPRCANATTGVREKPARRKGHDVIVTVADPCGCEVDENMVALQAQAAAATGMHGATR